MRSLMLLTVAAVLCAACKDSMAPVKLHGPDPTVLVQNQIAAGPDTVFLTWWDQSGAVTTFSVAPGVTACTHFSATLPADSVRFHVQASHLSSTSTQDSRWFLPDSAADSIWAGRGAFWTVNAKDDHTGGSPLLLVTADSLPPC